MDMRSLRRVALVSLMLPAAFGHGAPAVGAEARAGVVERGLREAVKSGTVPPGIRISYDDLHTLYGGTLIEVRGDGSAYRIDVSERGERETSRHVEKAALLELLKQFVAVRAWKQETPELPPIPDESRAMLWIELGGEKAGFWERYNEMEDNGRLLRIRESLDRLVPPAGDRR